MKIIHKIIIGIIVCIILGIPFLVYFIMVKQVPRNIDFTLNFIGFLGSYYGAIIGGAFTVVGIALTIKLTKLENKRDRELQLLPRFDYVLNDIEEAKFYKKEMGYFAYLFDPEEDKSSNREPNVNSLLVIKNVGIGTAIDCFFSIENFDVERDRVPVFFQHSKAITSVNAMEPGEEGSFLIHLELNFDKLSDDCFYNYNGTRQLKPGLLEKYKNFILDIRFEYSDLLNNRFYQIIKLKSNIYASYSNKDEIDGKYKCDLNLIDISRVTKL